MRTRALPSVTPAAFALAYVLTAATAPAATPAAVRQPDAVGQQAPAARAATHPAAAKSQASNAGKAGTAAQQTAPRTLEAIRIEGEIPVPQVLFITARDQRRFMDLHHRRYLLTSLEIGERTVFPAALAVVRTPASGTTREIQP